MIRRYTRVLLIVLVGLFLQSFGWEQNHNFNQRTYSPFSYSLEVTLNGEDFESIATDLYSRFGFEEGGLKKAVFVNALRGFLFLQQTNQLTNDRFLTVIDFTLSSKLKRMWILDLRQKTVVMNELVAHGVNSGNEYATSFSNKPESQQSSLGFYVTGEPYNGKHQFSLKLKGMEAGYNANAFARGIVMHGANYVNEEIVAAGQRIGRSFGCPAVDQKLNSTIVNLIHGGSCLYMHANFNKYLSKSKILNNSLYIPIEVLRKLQE